MPAFSLGWITSICHIRQQKRESEKRRWIDPNDEQEWQDDDSPFFSLPTKTREDVQSNTERTRARLKTLFNRAVIAATATDRTERIDESKSHARKNSFKSTLEASDAAATTAGENPGSLWSTYQSELSDSETLQQDEWERASNSATPEDADDYYSDEDILRAFNLYSALIDYSSDEACIYVTGTIDSTEWEKISELSLIRGVKKLRIDHNELCRKDSIILQQLLDNPACSFEEVTIANTTVGKEDSISPFVRVPLSNESRVSGGRVRVSVAEGDCATEERSECNEPDHERSGVPHRTLDGGEIDDGSAAESRSSRVALAPSVRIWRRLLKSLRENKNVSRVTLDNVNIDNRSKYYLFQFVSYASGLQSFALRNTKYSDGVALSQALFERDEPLEELDVRNNPIPHEHLSLLSWTASVDVSSQGHISPDQRELYHSLIQGQSSIQDHAQLHEILPTDVPGRVVWEESACLNPSQDEPGSTRRLCTHLTFHRPEGWHEPDGSQDGVDVMNIHSMDFPLEFGALGVDVREIARR